MSDSTNDTSAIDEKKNQDTTTSTTSYGKKILHFIFTTLIVILMIFVYFGISGLVLYTCKLAQCNILPTEQNCHPYTDVMPQVTPIQTNIFNTSTDPPMSMKLSFPYTDKNASYKLLEIMKPGSNFLMNYFVSIITELVRFTNSSLNITMNAINETFSESLIVVLGPIIYGIIYSVLLLFNQLYFIYLWFAEMKWFFKKNINEDSTEPPDWEDVTITDFINWCLGLVLSILFSVLLLFGGFAPLMFSIFAIFTLCIISTFMYSSVLNGKPSNVGIIMLQLFKEYKLTIVSVITVFVILLSFSKLGVLPGIFSIITLGLMYYGIISTDIFKEIKEQQHISPLTSYKQAKKTCSFKLPSKNKWSLYKWFLGQKGGNIRNELLKAGKTLSSK